MTKRELTKLRKSLMEARTALTDKVQKTEDYGREADAEGGARDLADKASSSYTKELMFSMSNADRQLLQVMDDALERMESGEYGHCQTCDEVIGKKRLEAVPWAILCISCKELEEAGRL